MPSRRLPPPRLPLRHPPSAAGSGNGADVLRRVGQAVRAWRRVRGLSRRALEAASGVSTRFLAQIESGSGNISLRRLDDLARALEVPLVRLLDVPPRDAGPHLALLGLRGAGKSTIGPRVARRLEVPFVELDTLIEAAAGLPVGQIFEIHGEPHFRRVERETLRRFLAGSGPVVLATGGGLVTEPETLAVLREHCTTVWLSATPEDHYNRVLALGDRRPMGDNPHAMAELRALLVVRQPLYEQADLTVDTSTLTVEEAAARIVEGLPG